MSAASLVVKRLLEKKPKTRQDIQLIKLEVAREEKFDSIPPNNQLLAEINAKAVSYTHLTLPTSR